MLQVFISLPMCKLTILITPCMPNQVLSHNSNGNTGGADILLGSSVDDSVLRHVNRLRDKVGAHVTDQDLVTHIRNTLQKAIVNQTER